MKKIIGIEREETYSKYPDYSFIGEWSDEWKEGAIDREERGEYIDRNQYKYFIPADMESAEQDYQDGLRLNNGSLWFIDTCLKAEIEINGIRQTIQSGWLCDILVSGSKEDESYLKEIDESHFAELKSILLEMGFSEEEIDSERM